MAGLLGVASVPFGDASFHSPPRCRSDSYSLSGWSVGPNSWLSLLPVASFLLAALRFGLFIPSGRENGSDSSSVVPSCCLYTRPPRPSISPPRALISPPGSESSRSFSITIKRPSGSEVEDDLKRGVSGAVPIPPDDAGKEEVINSLVANVEAMIKADRKITSLKQLQGHIWRTRFQNKELQGVVYDDVPEALRGGMLME
ncbi:uncharacterized protein LOC109709977 isoform X2 [Ananas comosus]|uniref:Uncharacterized protein LOC109709977 isoform X2 n=1 Tax=Ananas comosus TaxID=4615 RepID=A0A6P5EWK8_ANACO|nr:uncharacterized protein LOC109709977 isoform X2 [Ananas comosus]